ncbi:MAG TPA: glycerophosphodiester phosphodiesterase family protein [bacterium]|nr:glycerophosphodiester phosphodiesterase family protein [bacterium]
MKNILTVAHRGFSGRYPENTLLSFEKAVQMGVDFIELDVRETMDGKPVVIHDASTERTTGKTGNVNEMTCDEIKKLDAGEFKGYENVRIPFLEDVFDAMRGRTRILIEIKDASPSRILSLVKEFKMKEDVIIGSFKMEYLKEVRIISPQSATALISSTFPENPGVLLECGIPILDINHKRMNKEIACNFLAGGISLGVWTVDDEKEMEPLIDSGILFLTTNRPDVLHGLLGRK